MLLRDFKVNGRGGDTKALIDSFGTIDIVSNTHIEFDVYAPPVEENKTPTEFLLYPKSRMDTVTDVFPPEGYRSAYNTAVCKDYRVGVFRVLKVGKDGADLNICLTGIGDPTEIMSRLGLPRATPSEA